MSSLLKALFLAAVLGFVFYLSASHFRAAQRSSDFTTRTPLREGEYLVLAFQGGRDPWNKDNPLRRLSLRLASRPGVWTETVENQKRALAVQLIQKALDRNHDGQLQEPERASARLILFGQSFGGAAVVKLARQLDELQVPILLTVQIDSVGRDDSIIPPNVNRAANLFQRNGWIIRGEPLIVAKDPGKTAIVDNRELDYSKKQIDISHVPWHKKIFRVAHNQIEQDPEVWTRVEALIVGVIAETARPTSP